MTTQEVIEMREYCDAVQTIKHTSKVKLIEYADEYLIAKAKRRIRHSPNNEQTVDQIIAYYLGISEEEYFQWCEIVNSGNREMIEVWDKKLLTTKEVYDKLLCM